VCVPLCQGVPAVPCRHTIMLVVLPAREPCRHWLTTAALPSVQHHSNHPTDSASPLLSRPSCGRSSLQGGSAAQQIRHSTEGQLSRESQPGVGGRTGWMCRVGNGSCSLLKQRSSAAPHVLAAWPWPCSTHGTPQPTPQKAREIVRACDSMHEANSALLVQREAPVV
jgi:hypothetical protein